MPAVLRPGCSLSLRGRGLRSFGLEFAGAPRPVVSAFAPSGGCRAGRDYNLSLISVRMSFPPCPGLAPCRSAGARASVSPLPPPIGGAFRSRIVGLLAAGAACVAAGISSLPATPSLARDPQLTFAIVLQQALPRAPEYLELAARDEEARLHVAAARSWLAGRPSLEASYLDDRARSDRGINELEYGVQLPLWRPGERRAAVRLGSTLGGQFQAWRAHLELAIAGRLRETLRELDAADRLLALERQATAEAGQLVASVEKLHAAGEVAQTDVAQARTLLLQQRRQELQAELALASAESGYAELTGLSARPATVHREEPASRPAVADDHPWLRYLAAGVDVAGGAVEQARQEARGNPSVLVGARRQRGGEGEAYNDSLVVGLSLPFGASTQVDARVSSVRRQKAGAEVELKTARRDLARRLRELQLAFDHTAAALRLSAEQVALDRRQMEAARAAFELGELNLFQVLTALRQSRASAREHETLQLQRESLAVQINQTIGVLP